MNNLNCLVDLETKSILCFPKTILCANSLSLGFINSYACVLPTVLPWRAKQVYGFDIINDNLQLIPEGDAKLLAEHKEPNMFRKIPDHLLTEEFLYKRGLSKLRAKYLYSLEVYFYKNTVRTIDYFDKELNSYIIDQLRKCVPEEENFSYGIQEYARITEIPVKTAYQELTMKTETNGIIKMRNFAWYNKYVQVINQLHNKEDLKEAFQNALDDIFFKAKV